VTHVYTSFSLLSVQLTNKVINTDIIPVNVIEITAVAITFG